MEKSSTSVAKETFFLYVQQRKCLFLGVESLRKPFLTGNWVPVYPKSEMTCVIKCHCNQARGSSSERVESLRKPFLTGNLGASVSQERNDLCHPRDTAATILRKTHDQ
jgi:hypothetical protein